MLQNEMLKMFKENAKEREIDMTMADAKEILNVLSDTFKTAYAKLETGESVSFGVFKLEKTHRASRTGKSVQDGSTWVSPEKDIPTLTFTPSFTKENTIVK